MRENISLFRKKVLYLHIENKKKNMNQKRTFRQIAIDIRAAWKNEYFGASPYLDALLTLDTTNPNENYMFDTAGSVARYFLANAGKFRGARAKELKDELKSLLEK